MPSGWAPPPGPPGCNKARRLPRLSASASHRAGPAPRRPTSGGAAAAEGRWRAGGGRWGWRDWLGAARGAVGAECGLPAAVRAGLCGPWGLRPVGAMGNCHTVGPNEALVVSGEGAAGEVGLGAQGGRRWGSGAAVPGKGDEEGSRAGERGEEQARGGPRGWRAVPRGDEVRTPSIGPESTALRTAPETFPENPPLHLRCSAPPRAPPLQRVVPMFTPPFSASSLATSPLVAWGVGARGDPELKLWGSGRERNSGLAEFQRPGRGEGGRAALKSRCLRGERPWDTSFPRALGDPLIPSRLGLAGVSWH